MTLPKCLTTVTPFSKIIALILFITLPLIGFYLGTKYQKHITPNYEPVLRTKMIIPKISPMLLITPTPTLSSMETYVNKTSDWKIYTNKNYNFELKYPPSTQIVEFNTPRTIGNIKVLLSVQIYRISPGQKTGQLPPTNDWLFTMEILKKPIEMNLYEVSNLLNDSCAGKKLGIKEGKLLTSQEITGYEITCGVTDFGGEVIKTLLTFCSPFKNETDKVLYVTKDTELSDDAKLILSTFRFLP